MLERDSSAIRTPEPQRRVLTHCYLFCPRGDDTFGARANVSPPDILLHPPPHLAHRLHSPKHSPSTRPTCLPHSTLSEDSSPFHPITLFPQTTPPTLPIRHEASGAECKPRFCTQPHHWQHDEHETPNRAECLLSAQAPHSGDLRHPEVMPPRVGAFNAQNVSNAN